MAEADESERVYTLTEKEFRQASYALGSMIGLLNESHVSVMHAHKVVNTLAHANEAMKMLHSKNP